MKSEIITIGKDTEYPLKGRLTLPSRTYRPVPAVVFVHGSGASNMDEKVIRLTPFKDLAEGLAEYGIASIRYDKRTYTYGRQMRKTDEAITVKEETIDDAIQAIRLIKKDIRIDPENVFILGHSMGAMLAPRIDTECGECKGLILMAGSPLRLDEIVLQQLQEAMKTYNPVKRGIIQAQYNKYAKAFENLFELSDEEAKEKKFAGNVSLYYFKEMGQRTALDYLRDYDKPVLMLHGGKDVQAFPEGFEIFQKELADKNNIQYKLYPDLNHAFVPALSDDINKASREFMKKRNIGVEVIGDIAKFIRQVTSK